MSFQDEYRALMAKPIEEISEDIFFRPDNFQIGVCQAPEEYTLQVRKALKVMGYDTHTALREGKTFILPGEPQPSPAEAGDENRAE